MVIVILQVVVPIYIYDTEICFRYVCIIILSLHTQNEYSSEKIYIYIHIHVLLIITRSQHHKELNQHNIE